MYMEMHKTCIKKEIVPRSLKRTNLLKSALFTLAITVLHMCHTGIVLAGQGRNCALAHFTLSSELCQSGSRLEILLYMKSAINAALSRNEPQQQRR